MANTKILKKKEIEKTAEQKKLVVAPVLTSMMIMINYNDTLNTNVDELGLDITEIRRDVFNTYMMRRLIHIDVLNLLATRVLISGLNPYDVSELADYCSLFVELYKNKKENNPINECFGSLFIELRIDDFIARIPGYNPHKRVLVGAEWFEFPTMLFIVSTTIYMQFSLDVIKESMNNCMTIEFETALKAMNISTLPLGVIRLGADIDE